MSPEALELKRQRLLRLQVEVDQQIAAIEAAQRMFSGKPGRPRIALTYTADEARDLHRRYRAGERTPEAQQGHREYNRMVSRAKRSREKTGGRA